MVGKFFLSICLWVFIGMICACTAIHYNTLPTDQKTRYLKLTDQMTLSQRNEFLEIKDYDERETYLDRIEFGNRPKRKNIRMAMDYEEFMKDPKATSSYVPLETLPSESSPTKSALTPPSPETDASTVTRETKMIEKDGKIILPPLDSLDSPYPVPAQESEEAKTENKKKDDEEVVTAFDRWMLDFVEGRERKKMEKEKSKKEDALNTQANQKAASYRDTIAQDLSTLSHLHDEGKLTNEEYRLAKQSVLAGK